MKTPTLNIKELALLKSNPQQYYEKAISKSYSHKPHLQGLPYDRNTTNPLKMCARYIACKKLEEELVQQISIIKDSDLRDGLNELRRAKEELDDKKRIYEEHKKKYDAVENENKKQLELKKEQLHELVLDGEKILPKHLQDRLKKLDKEIYGDGDAFLTENQKEHVRLLSQDMDWEADQGDYYDDETGHFDERGQDILAIGVNLERICSNDGLDKLLQMRAEVPSVSYTQLLNEELDIELRTADVKDAIKDVRQQKHSVHETTSQLLDVVDEEMNCVDSFRRNFDGGYYMHTSPTEDIEQYIAERNIQNYLNKDGTIDESYISRDKMDWYETNTRPYPQ